MRVIDGRSVNPTDAATSLPVVVVNPALVTAYLDERHAIGSSLPLGSRRTFALRLSIRADRGVRRSASQWVVRG